MPTEEYLKVFFTAVAPISELRGAIPLGINANISWPVVFIIAVAGNLLPVPFLLLFLEPITNFLSRVQVFKRIINWVFRHSRRRSNIVKRYERIGLTIFVAIPLPLTGAWTGSIVAFLLGLSFWRAFISIIFGVLIAGVIVTTAAVLLDYAFFTSN